MSVNLRQVLDGTSPVMLTDTNVVAWSRNQGSIIATISGSTGPTGPQGPQGATGPQGPPGGNIVEYDGGSSTTIASSFPLLLDMGASA